LVRLGGEELASRKTFLRFKARDAQTSSLGRLLPSRLPKPDIEKDLNRTMFAPTVITPAIYAHDMGVNLFLYKNRRGGLV
jgi:hypothetical protein